MIERCMMIILLIGGIHLWVTTMEASKAVHQVSLADPGARGSVTLTPRFEAHSVKFTSSTMNFKGLIYKFSKNIQASLLLA